jgi:Fic family protein
MDCIKMTQLTNRQQQILEIIDRAKTAAISDIGGQLKEAISIPTLNRDIANLVSLGYLKKTGKGRSTAYHVSSLYKIFAPVELDKYFDSEPDQRDVVARFNYDLFSMLENTPIFTKEESAHLEELKCEYAQNIASISPALYQKEIERLTIELSWKSSQIEGNTYSLLETEILFLEHKAAKGKTQEEATMLLNHKDCLDFILKNREIGKPLNLSVIEAMHSLLIKDLGVDRNLRSRIVGITGTSYKPLDNTYQIKEAIEAMCGAINARQNGFERALLAVAFISYIQPFEDGNKRTGRMVSNAVLISDGACPLSYRSVESLEYKKAMLLFYEQNNLSAFKELFIKQIEFAVKNYFQ